MNREPSHLTGDDVDPDDLLTIGVPRRGCAVEAIAAVFRGEEGPIPERPSRHGRIMAEVVPRRIGKEALVVRERPLLRLVEPGGIVRDIYAPEPRTGVAIVGNHVIAV